MKLRDKIYDSVVSSVGGSVDDKIREYEIKR